MKDQLLAVILVLVCRVCIAQTSFPQTQINSMLGADSPQHSNPNTTLPRNQSANSLIPLLNRMAEIKASKLPTVSRRSSRSLSDTIYVGAQTNDTLVITGNFTHTGPIFVFNYGVLIIRNASVIDTGDIYIWQHGKMYADSSSLTFPQHYFYERGLTLVQNGYARVQHCSFNYSGMSHNLLLADSAVVIMNYIHQNDWPTCGLNGASTLSIHGCNVGGEHILSDHCTARFSDVDTLILWHQIPDTAVINYSFPRGDTVFRYAFDNSVNGVRGINYHVSADTCHDVMWAIMPVNGADITISSSSIRAIGAWFRGQDTVTARGVFDNSSYVNFTVPLSDRHLQLINSKVQTWSLYAFDQAHLNIDSCTLGEVGCQQRSSVLGQNFLLDGSGGYYWATDTSVVLASGVTIYSTARSEHNGIFLLQYSWLPFAPPSAIGNSVMICVQNDLVQDPVAFDNGNVWMAKIEGPDTAHVDSVIPVPGSVWIAQGPLGGWMFFASYSLSYQRVGDTTWTKIVRDSAREVHSSDLGLWHTQGLSTGSYLLKLSIKDTHGDSVYGLKLVTLLPVSTIGLNDVSLSDASVSVFPNPSGGNFVFRISAEKRTTVSIEMRNALGERLFTKERELNNGPNMIAIDQQLPAGMYFYRITANGTSVSGKVMIKAKLD